MEFSERLQQCRKAAGVTQTELAEYVGVLQKDVSRWEKGIYKPNINYLVKICTRLNVSADVLLGLKDE
jgi:transcriptional regulator with XRE-family HTH domain